jgi:phosphatidylinositol 3-kinase
MSLLDEGTIFRIEASITGMGVPCHDTPIASVYSTPLAPMGHCPDDDDDGSTHAFRNNNNSDNNNKSDERSKAEETDWNLKSLEPVLTATHGCRWSTMSCNKTSTAASTTSATATSVAATTAAAPSVNPLNRLVFPVLYKHVQRDACFIIRLWAFHPKTAEMKMIRQASFPLWDEKGRFPTGLQRIHLHPCTSLQEEGGEEDEDGKIWDQHGMCQCKDDKWDAIQILEQLYVMEQEQCNDLEDGRDPGDYDCDGKGGPYGSRASLSVNDATSSVTSLGTSRSKSRGGSTSVVSSSSLSSTSRMTMTRAMTRTRTSKSLEKRNITTTAALEPVPWLDKLTKEWCRNVLMSNKEEEMEEDLLSSTLLSDGTPVVSNRDTAKEWNLENQQGEYGHYHRDLFYSNDIELYNDHEQQDATTVHLVVEFPDCKVPIVHQEVLYAGGMHGASGSVTALDLALFHHEQQVFKHARKVQGKQICEDGSGVVVVDVDEGGDGIGRQVQGLVLMPEPMHVNLREDSSHAMNYRMVQFLDMECADDNPVEDKYRTLQHELIRGLVDPALKPDASERSRLNAIISSTSQHLTREEKDLLWKFRFSLVDNKRALTKFLLAVEWTVESEVVQAAELLEQWRKRSPIEVSDALKLLGKNVAFQTGLVRSYAIDTLASAPDAELELYLLQLVQALKYEQPVMSEGDSRTLGTVSTQRDTKVRDGSSSSLGLFLIERASKNIELANYLYWYLRVEQEDATFGERYREVFNAMKDKLSKIHYDSKSGTEKRSMWDILSAQDAFISGILECQKASFHVRGKKDAKEQYLRDALNSPSCKSIRNGWDVPLPSAPHIWVKGVKAESAKMFKSAMYPALLEFYVENKTTNASTYKVIVKTGDDLRQDQLVIMLIKLFDRILKRGALDLCLRPYPILAMSAVDQTGLVEFVEGSIPVSQILANHNNSIMSFFKSVAPNDAAKYGVDPTVLQTYIRSCAGYCVITYLIGVGDRHL